MGITSRQARKVPSQPSCSGHRLSHLLPLLRGRLLQAQRHKDLCPGALEGGVRADDGVHAQLAVLLHLHALRPTEEALSMKVDAICVQGQA